MSKVRRATHAGSWYKGNVEELNYQLEDWLQKAGSPSLGPARAIIAPHAGYFYCGDCAAHAYRQVDPTYICFLPICRERVFILGPSHHYRLSGCALSSAHKHQTPFYDLHVDVPVYERLYESGLFEQLSLSVDEDEHSIEMHLPYIAKVMERKKGNFTIVPILVGSLSYEKEAEYGRLLSPLILDPRNLFVISSDFCHWGQRFRYQYHDRSVGEIWRSIENLDRMGMQAIESLNPTNFTDYLGEYQNTICGRHPIGVLLNAIHAIRMNGNGRLMNLKFIKYSQSSKCTSKSDSSVSYAAASFVVKDF